MYKSVPGIPASLIQIAEIFDVSKQASDGVEGPVETQTSSSSRVSVETQTSSSSRVSALDEEMRQRADAARNSGKVIRYNQVCVCVFVFIKLHITAQSGLVILVILCHSH